MPDIPRVWLDGEPVAPKITDLCLAYQKICELGIAMNLHPANQHPGCLEIRLDDHWQISFNGHQQPMPCAHGHGVKVYPFNAYARYNGLPAGLITPFGGTIAAGEAANEVTLLAALDAAIAQHIAPQKQESNDDRHD